nr:unnamed protein product [Digitaria exilis]
MRQEQEPSRLDPLPPPFEIYATQRRIRKRRSEKHPHGATPTHPTNANPLSLANQESQPRTDQEQTNPHPQETVHEPEERHASNPKFRVADESTRRRRRRLDPGSKEKRKRNHIKPFPSTTLSLSFLYKISFPTPCLPPL